MAQLRAAEPVDLEARHHLAVPEAVTPTDIEALALTRWPAARWDSDGHLVMSPRARLLHPLALPRWVARSDGLPESAAWTYGLDVPVERGAPAAERTMDPTGLAEAFPDGLPIREEGRVLSWAIDCARHVGGAVRLAPTGVVLHPQAWDVAQQTVYSDVWLAPDAGQAVCQEIFAGMRLATATHTWQPPDIPSTPRAPGVELEEPELRDLHQAAQEFDLRAAQEGAFLDGYSLVLDARERGVIAVEVGPCETVPVPVASRDWDVTTLSCYRVFWAPRDEPEALDPHPVPALITLRQWAASSVSLVAKAIHRVCGGVLLDAGGFPL